ncbi:MAG: HAD-IIIC family phosphatase [Rhodospirillaceae bacterium]|nr:HAD-IIIC family phosphatase [Rhodospirillales bacterium]
MLRDAMARIKALAGEGEHEAAWRLLSDTVDPSHDFPAQQRLARAARAIDAKALGLRHVRLALLAGCTLDHFADILRLHALARGIRLEVWTAPFDTVEQTILDPGSELYTFAPDVAWIFTTHRDVSLRVSSGASAEEADGVVAQAVGQTTALWSALLGRHRCQVLHNTADIPANDLFGNLEANHSWGRRNLLRAYNLGLSRGRPHEVTLFDLDHVSALHGKNRWFDARYWYHSKHAFGFDAAGLVAHEAAAVLTAQAGLSKKCLVLDLDNTLWGGVIGDDGLDGIRLGGGAEGEAFADLQAHAKALKDRGIVLAVCSKNDESNAKAPFQTHPEMRLSLDDIAVFRANWDNKADNIRYIAEVLNLGLDSFVFLDDNPAERALVRNFLPMVAVPELPQDPALYLETLIGQRYFEPATFAAEDAERADYYRDNSRRLELQQGFADVGAYLASLEMQARCGAIDAVRLPRVAQLINKSNQFHLTGTRYSEAQIRELLDGGQYKGLWFDLTDRFGDNGLISAVLLKQGSDGIADIDTWVMSCRVLSRGMEEFILNSLAAAARSLGHTVLRGTYVPSRKNGLVKMLYDRLGFVPVAEDAGGTTRWQLDLTECSPLPTAIAAVAKQAEPAPGEG